MSSSQYDYLVTHADVPINLTMALIFLKEQEENSMRMIGEMIEIMESFRDGMIFEYCDDDHDWVQIKSRRLLLECLHDDCDIRVSPNSIVQKVPKIVSYGNENTPWLIGRKAKLKNGMEPFTGVIGHTVNGGVFVTGYGAVSFGGLKDDWDDVTDEHTSVAFARYIGDE